VNVRAATIADVPLVADVVDEATAFVRTKGRDQWPVPYPHEKLRKSVSEASLYVVEVDGEPAARDLPGIRRYYERLGFELRDEVERGDFAWALYERRVA
jgi:hypothetical protein